MISNGKIVKMIVMRNFLKKKKELIPILSFRSVILKPEKLHDALEEWASYSW